MENKLISAKALMKAIREFRWLGPPNTLKLMFEYLRLIIRDQPAVDAVEVVRCKDCKHCAVASWGERYCARSRLVQLDDLNEDDFCSYGERRTDNA